ncbi:glycosyltransferase [Streptococcus sp. S784/96/1]|uniref:glycosyltransferase n=1 Tax=Streptococcus sp. S784/96/1 TaxID=2653499 RepID=UPI001386DEF7|nr:glycosyltransferase [Streptococcus sp. S784/96/1]
MARILFLTSTMQGGGAERVIANLSGFFADKGHTVGILATGGNILEYNLHPKVIYLYTSPKTDLFAFKQLSKIFQNNLEIKNFKPDVVVGFLPTPIIYGALSKFMRNHFRYIISERMDPYQDPKNILLRKVRNLAFRFGDCFVFQTDDAKEYYGNIVRGKSKIILNPIKADLPSAYISQLSKKIVTVARLEPQKNILLLIKAFGLLKRDDFQLHIYGTGSEEQALKQYVLKHEISNVNFEGFCSDIHDKIKDATAFVLPSNYEGMSNAMLEAMVMGLPIIVTDHPIGAPKMLIDNLENGILVPINNPEELAKAMRLLIDDFELQKKLSNNSKKIKKLVSSEVIYQQWEEVILSE